MALLFAMRINAQNYDLKIYSGKSALSSGLGMIGTYTNEDSSSTWMLEFNQTLGQVVYMKKYGNFLVGPTFGQQNNALWAAPILIWKPYKFISFTTWEGILAGKPNEPNWNVNFFFAYQAVDICIKNFTTGYSVLHYLEERPMNMPFVKYVIPITKVDKIDISVTYNMRDDTPMFLVAGCHTF